MRKLAYLVVAIASLALAGAALADPLEEKEKVKTEGSKGVTWTTQTGGNGFAEFKVNGHPKYPNKPVKGSTVVVKVGNTPADLDVDYTGKVTCIEQTGNQAVFAGPRDDSSGLFFRISVEDNGKQKKDNKDNNPPDRIRVQDLQTSADCSFTPDPFNDVLTGDIKVD